LTTNFYSNSTGATGPIQLSFPVNPGVNKSFVSNLQLGGGTGGSRIAIGLPSGAQIWATVIGLSTAPNSQISSLSVPSLTTNIWCCAGVVGPMLIQGVVISPVGVTGIAQVQIGNMASTGLTGSVQTGSWIQTYTST